MVVPMHLDRRTLLGAGAGLALTGITSSAPHRAGSLRVIVYNVHAFGPVAETDEGKQLAGRVRENLVEHYALELGLYRPDVLCLQEATSAERVATLAKRLGMHHRYFPGGARNDDGSVHPMFNGAILSRLPILESQDCPSPSAQADRKQIFSRHLGRALIDTGKEGFGPVTVIGAHMLPAWENTTSIREAEIAALGEVTADDRSAGRSILVLGDMNHTPEMPEYAGWKTIGLTDCAVAQGEGSLHTHPSLRPSQRIDYVFAAGPILEHLSSCRTLAEGRFRQHSGGPEVRGSFALSDHMPVMATFGK